MTQVIDATGFIPDDWAGTQVPELAGYTGGAAVLLPPDADPTGLVSQFDTLSLIVIPFASNTDGRGFSLAATLRSLGYAGHIRARGHVLVDQFRAALRAGFDDVEISDTQAQRNPEPQWLAVPFLPDYRTRIFAR